ncbi:hypothetical protein CEXT_172471 [Caerostris extrusa]|uniref:Uncharacterized protein n=1 Tax=Caerostris extrusa TaxID=172846 RepID=A0AAV4VHN5_CAEEX|nr:hypothetical protein CEXT_172471 [Caerostris extrusa]
MQQHPHEAPPKKPLCNSRVTPLHENPGSSRHPSHFPNQASNTTPVSHSYKFPELFRLLNWHCLYALVSSD